MSVDQKSIVIIEASFAVGGKDSTEFKEYSRRSNANGEANGGVVLSKYPIQENLGDGGKPDVVMVIEYPSAAHAKLAFSNSEYQAIIPLRQRAFKEVKILIV